MPASDELTVKINRSLQVIFTITPTEILR